MHQIIHYYFKFVPFNTKFHQSLNNPTNHPFNLLVRYEVHLLIEMDLKASYQSMPL